MTRSVLPGGGNCSMITDMDDHELLRKYDRERSEEAFRELVDRHLGMVYAAARRMVRDWHLAEEVAQDVFCTLARKAGTVRPPQVIAGWLLPNHAAPGDAWSEKRTTSPRKGTGGSSHAIT